MARQVIGMLLAAGFAADTAWAAPQTFEGDYVVSLYGIPIGKSSFSTTIDGERFRVEGSVASAGLARVFDGTRGAVAASGRIAGDRVRPTAYRMSYTSGRRSRSIAIDFGADTVDSTEIKPAPRPRGENWVALDRNDLARVTDPLSSSLVRAETPQAVCSQTLRVYDGQSRMDLALSPAGTRRVTVPGFDGEAVTCAARFTPVSGYRKGQKSVEFLKDRSDIRIAFAPLGETGVYAPVHASIRTEIGTVTVEVQRYEARN